MPDYRTPGVYIVEQPGPKTVQAVGTSVAAFLGQAPDAGAHLGEAVAINNWSQFCAEFAAGDNVRSTFLSHAVNGFLQNGGGRAFIVNIAEGDAIAGTDRPRRTGLKLLEEIDEVSIVLSPGRYDVASHEALLSYCEKVGNCVAICDPPQDVKNTELLKIVETAAAPSPAKGKDKDKDKDAGGAADTAAKPGGGLRPRLSVGGFGTFYFPWLYVADALNPRGGLVPVPPSGHMAGIWAGTDTRRGVQKAPANVPVAGALNLTYRVTDAEQADLNSKGVNVIRFFSTEGNLVWGARTLAEESSEWRYLNVRRLVIMIEESIKRATRWVVFEPNDRTLWKTIRSEITGFLTSVYRDGALMGATAEEAFFVKCDEETNSQESIDMGQVNIVIGIAPVKPAEFVIFKIAQFEEGTEVKTL
jgi:phage tail sheath protein FI